MVSHKSSVCVCARQNIYILPVCVYINVIMIIILRMTSGNGGRVADENAKLDELVYVTCVVYITVCV